MALLARDLMQPPLTLQPEMPVLEIAHLFTATQVSGAPVVDDAGAVVGMVSALDLLTEVDQVTDDEVDEDPSGGGDAPASLGTLTARDVAIPEVTWVRPDAAVAEVARQFRDEGLQRVLVGVDGQLEGVLTPFDLLAAIEGV